MKHLDEQAVVRATLGEIKKRGQGIGVGDT